MEANNLKYIIKKLLFKSQIPILKKKFNFMKDKKVLVLGSGPNVKISENKLENYIIVCCNGSAGYLKKNNLNISPYLTIIDNELIDKDIVYEKDVRNQIIKKKLLKDMNLGNLISVQSNNSKNSDPKILEAKFNTFTLINKNFRRIIVNNLVNTNFIEKDDQSLLSTGVFSICLCFLLGASRVEFTGFSFWKKNIDYFYSEVNNSSQSSENIRNHSLADSFFISLLKIKKFNLFTEDQDYLPFMTNWGDK